MKKVKLGRPAGFFPTFERRPGENKLSMHYCPGCGHGILHKLIAEAIADFGIQDRTVLIAPVGCSVFAYYYFDCFGISAPHGRAPAVGTGLARANPDNIVISYQGDGDLGAIGFNQLIQAANRGENMAVFFVNNAIYGMTGGQMAPTTLVGQRTTTSPTGRDAALTGYPLKMSEMLAQVPGAVFVERVSVHNPVYVRKAKKAIRRAFEVQLAGEGFGIVEVLSTCPTNWGLEPTAALGWLEENMIPYYPLGNLRDPGKREG